MTVVLSNNNARSLSTFKPWCHYSHCY